MGCDCQGRQEGWGTTGEQESCRCAEPAPIFTWLEREADVNMVGSPAGPASSQHLGTAEQSRDPISPCAGLILCFQPPAHSIKAGPVLYPPRVPLPRPTSCLVTPRPEDGSSRSSGSAKESSCYPYPTTHLVAIVPKGIFPNQIWP